MIVATAMCQKAKLKTSVPSLTLHLTFEIPVHFCQIIIHPILAYLQWQGNDLLLPEGTPIINKLSLDGAEISL